MIVVSVALRAQSEKRLEFLSAIGYLMPRVRWLPGCLSCRLVTECDAADTFSLVAEWDDRESLERFLGSRELDILQGMRLLLRDDPRAIVDDVVTRARLPLRAASLKE